MSFSSNTKDELSKLNNWTDKAVLKAELNGYFLTTNVTYNSSEILFTTENECTAKRYAKILQNLNTEYAKEEKGKLFIIKHSKIDNSEDIDIENDNILVAVLRGAFMASGAINDPLKKYHLEIFVKSKENAKFLIYITEKFGINAKLLKREKNYSVYLKEGQAISNLLALIGANKSVLDFEEIRVMREMKNNVNRLVNCETANLTKIVNVAVKQIEDINYIISKGRFDELTENLKEIAELRIENPDMSLIDLGKLLKEPVGKSGVNYRLKKIIELAND